MISPNVVDACGLVPESVQPEAYHAYGMVKDVPAFLVSIRLPNNVSFSGIRVAQGNFRGADVLIGMDIIARGDFAVTNQDGKTKFSFRIPSQADIDFVVEDNRENVLNRQSKPRNRRVSGIDEDVRRDRAALL